jgi:hypothetical protein
MPIISSYPLKQGPLDSKDEIIISDAESNDPRFKTKNTNLKAISSFNNVNFDFTQGVPSATWIIQHDLNKYPSATVVDSGKNVNIGDITYDSKNQITIRFSAPFSGEAYLN